LPSGISIRNVTAHRSVQRRWIGLPAKPQIDPDGNVRRGADGKIVCAQFLELAPAIRDRFQQQALAAIDEHRAKPAETA
jgi:hypothetical protein